MRVYTLRCISKSIFRNDPENEVCTEQCTIETEECVTVSEMVENFNKMLGMMGFAAKVDVAEDTE
jgi:hypothetical protein